MEHKVLDAAVRPTRGKSNARRLRNDGKIPAVVYGHEQNRVLTLDAHEFSTVFREISESTIVTLKAGDQSHDVLIKDCQNLNGALKPGMVSL